MNFLVYEKTDGLSSDFQIKNEVDKGEGKGRLGGFVTGIPVELKELVLDDSEDEG